MIPSYNSSHAYLGPIEKDNSEENATLFPYDKANSPFIYIRNLDEPYNLKFLDTRVFRLAPRVDKVEDYIAWLDRIEKHKGSFWKDLGICNLIQLSRQGHR